MLSKILIGVFLGAGIGGLFGSFMKSIGGTCPMTCNPIGGMLFGALIGFIIASNASTPKYTPSQHVQEVSDEETFNSILSKNEIVLVDFYADWCGPCKRLKPTIHQLADELVGKVAVVAVNVDKGRSLAGKYGVNGIPDMRVFVSGKQQEHMVGYKSKSGLLTILEKYLNNKENK